MPRWSNLFKVTKKRVKCKRKACFSFHFRVTSKFGVSQSYEKSSAEQNKHVYFLCRDGVTYLKLRLSEQKTKTF